MLHFTTAMGRLSSELYTLPRTHGTLDSDGIRTILLRRFRTSRNGYPCIHLCFNTTTLLCQDARTLLAWALLEAWCREDLILVLHGQPLVDTIRWLSQVGPAKVSQQQCKQGSPKQHLQHPLMHGSHDASHVQVCLSHTSHQ